MKQEIKIEVPTKWSAVSLKKYLALRKDLDTYAGEEEAITAVLFHHLCKFPLEYVQQLNIDTYIAIRQDLINFFNNVDLPLQKFITIDGVQYGFEPDLSRMAYGAYVDISKYETFEINEKWAEIMSILYRPVIKTTGKMYDVKAYDGNIDGEKFMDVSMDIHFGTLFFFENFIKGLTERYPEVFDGIDGSTSEHQIRFGKKWKSYSSLVQLAQNDITRFEEITKEPLEKCLLMLSYQADIALLEELMYKEAIKKGK